MNGDEHDALTEKLDGHGAKNGLIEEPEPANDLELIEALENISSLDIENFIVPATESEAQLTLSALTLNAKQKLYNSLNLNDLDLIDIFGSTDDPGIARVGMILALLEAIDYQLPAYNVSGLCNSENIVVKCAVQAVIPCNIVVMIGDLTGGVISAGSLYHIWQHLPYQTRQMMLREMAKAAGKRVTWIGVAWMFADFAACVYNGGDLEPSPVENCPHVPHNNILNEPLVLSPTIIYGYTAYHSHLGDFLGSSPHIVPFPGTYAFLNPSDSLYYMNNTYTKILPNGYYFDFNDMGSNNPWKYVKVEAGQPIEIGEALNLDPYRCLEAFDPSTHAPFFD